MENGLQVRAGWDQSLDVSNVDICRCRDSPASIGSGEGLRLLLADQMQAFPDNFCRLHYEYVIIRYQYRL